MTKKVHKSKRLQDLEAGDCRWPIGDPRHADFHFCGAQQVLGRPYCIQHWPLSFDASKSRHHAKPSAQPVKRAA
jgi:GcrA cell cycle regulator